jgi:dTMP kinase
VQNEIVPALETGDVVISDRYVYSSLAYQGAAGLSLEWIEKVNSHALRPDIALFLDVDLGTVMKRLKPRKSVMENLETQERVRGYYLDLVKVGLLRRVDGNRVKSEIAEETFSIVQDFLVSRA